MTLRIITTSSLISICYFTIGLQLAVVPLFVHLHLGFSPMVAGLAISVQYIATLISRPLAGRTADAAGAKRTTSCGLLVCGASGAGFALAALLRGSPGLGVLLASRLLLGFGESWVATGATIWGMGRVGVADTAEVISWAGIASYGALAAGAPLGLWLDNTWGTAAIGVASVVVSIVGIFGAFNIGGVPIIAGRASSFARVLRSVFPYGLCLTLGGIGYGTIASFVTLYFASRHWENAALALSCFGASFVFARLLFVRTIDEWGGFRVAIVSLSVECCGLLLLWLVLQRDFSTTRSAVRVYRVHGHR
jgi:MFS family permease